MATRLLILADTHLPKRARDLPLPVAHIMDRTCYGRQQDWEDSPAGWPLYPTYG